MRPFLLFLLCLPLLTLAQNQQPLSQTQTVEVINDSLFFLVTTTTYDNGTDFPDSTKFRQLLGDSLTAANVVYVGAVNDNQVTAGSIREAIECRQHDSRWNSFAELYSQITGIDLADTVEVTYAPNFVGSAAIRVPVSLLTLENVGDITTETLVDILASGASRIGIEFEFYLTSSGNLRLRNVETGATWNCNSRSSAHIEIRNFLGSHWDMFFIDAIDQKSKYLPPNYITDPGNSPVLIVKR